VSDRIARTMLRRVCVIPVTCPRVARCARKRVDSDEPSPSLSAHQMRCVDSMASRRAFLCAASRSLLSRPRAQFPPTLAVPRGRHNAAASDSDSDSDSSAWRSFLEALHKNGYFAAAAAEDEGSSAAFEVSAKGLIHSFGSPGDHKRAVLAHARARDSQLHLLPVTELETLASAVVPQLIVDSTFGGRKAVNAVKRLRSHLQLPTPQNCAVARHGHPAQGEASLQDAARLILCWMTTPATAPPPSLSSAVDVLLGVLKDMPAGIPREFDARAGREERSGDKQRRDAQFGRREETRKFDLSEVRGQRSSLGRSSRRDSPSQRAPGRFSRSAESLWSQRPAAPRSRMEPAAPVRVERAPSIRWDDMEDADSEPMAPLASRRSQKYERRFEMPPPAASDTEPRSRVARNETPSEPRPRVTRSEPLPVSPVTGEDGEEGLWAGLPK